VEIDRVRASYDAIAERYADEIAGELAHKPLDRALLGVLAELVHADGTGTAVIGDVGCGPGHMAAYLADLGADVIGVDLSPGMVEVAGKRHPGLTFTVGSLLDLPAGDATWSGAVSAYSIIHLAPDERPAAYAELARVIGPGGWLLISFHVEHLGEGVGPGQVLHWRQWWGHEVDLRFHFIDPAEVRDGLTAAGFDVMARTQREPWPNAEAPTRRCYLLARRRG
jgi:SAM-dependent methyltransferase